MTLPKDIYCQSDKPKKPAIVKLLRSLYGLKQAGKYTCLIHDSCVYIKRNPDTGKAIIVVVYVDDILFIENDKDEIQKILTHVDSRVTAMTTMGEVTRYIQSNEVHDKSAKPIPMQPQAS